MKTYKYKMYSKAKDGQIDNQIDRFGILYNHCIALHRRYYRLTGKYIDKARLQHHLARIKYRPRWIPICHGLDAQAMQNVVERIHNAYRLFFGNLKRCVKTSPPSFKKVRKYSSFSLKQNNYEFDGNRVRIGKRWYGFHKSREFYGKVKTVTVKRDRCGDIWLCVVTDWNDSEKLPTSGKSVGYDFGMKTFLIASDGNDVSAPLFLKEAKKENEKLSHRISSKVNGSNNRRKAVLSKARFMRELANRRNDFQWKLTNDLVRKYDVMCFEDLCLKGMAKRRRKKGQKHGRSGFGRKVSEYGFYSFLQKLKYVAAKHGKEVVLVNRFFPSSQTCHECGYVNKAVRDVHIRKWTCPKCGAVHDRDRNAAMNILREGTSSLGRESVRPTSVRRTA